MSAAAQAPSRSGLLHIGAVCRRLRAEFPDVSISKIRYLEEQGLLAPKRTRGGYRLFDEDAVERLRTILRLQRDEFLPLRVIRQELASPAAGKSRRRRRRGRARRARGGAGRARARGTLGRHAAAACASSRNTGCSSRAGMGEKRYAVGDAEIAAVCAQLSSFGIGPRNLRPFRTASDREASLLEQLVGADALRRATPSAARLLSPTCGRSPSSRRSSPSCCSGGPFDSSLPS